MTQLCLHIITHCKVLFHRGMSVVYLCRSSTSKSWAFAGLEKLCIYASESIVVSGRQVRFFGVDFMDGIKYFHYLLSLCSGYQKIVPS